MIGVEVDDRSAKALRREATSARNLADFYDRSAQHLVESARLARRRATLLDAKARELDGMRR